MPSVVRIGHAPESRHSPPVFCLPCSRPSRAPLVLTRNAAIERIGPQTTSLFGNLIPVSTFTIEIARGYRPGAVELAGAVLTVGALVTDDVLVRRRARSVAIAREEQHARDEQLAAAA